ncbi:hypothetical protein [Clostridium sp. 1xD42-85]|nr:hypothetical protein [Clostridium sp. 1xD42-85]
MWRSGAFYIIITLGIPIFVSRGFALWNKMGYLPAAIAIILAFTGIGVLH